jgi:hypothetical protein
MARGAGAGYAEWLTGDREDGRDGLAAARNGDAAGAPLRDRQALRDATEDWGRSGGPSGSLDPREAIRRARASSPIAAHAEESPLQDRMVQPPQARAGLSSGGLEGGAGLDGMSTGVIERLLREQNELIKQDLQSNAYPPIAAPPPLRGGGIRM